ncbi:MAG: LAGLIDADG family homing endonuclease [Candidatus Dojkabacteria bacterium]
MIKKEVMIDYLKQGLSTRDLAKISGESKSNVGYWINKYGITDLMKYKKSEYTDIHYFNKIDTKEKAYILGFTIGDGHIDKRNQFSCSIQLQDREILDFISSEVGCNIQVDKTYNKKQRKHPNASITIGNPMLCRDIQKQFGGRLKQERRIPIIPKHLERYLVLGFFDAEGCVTWGFRKDRNRLWQKISFTSQLHMLESIQKILIKQNIATTIRPKSDSDCYVLNFSDKDRVSMFLNYIYPNDEFIILKRKYKKAQALRLELGEFGEV